MFGGKFGKIRFGLQEADFGEFEVKARFYESIRSTSAFGLDFDAATAYSETFASDFLLTKGVPFTVLAEESVQTNVELLGTLPIVTRIEEKLLTDILLSENIYTIEQIKEKVKASVWLSETIDFFLNLSGAVKPDIQFGKNIWNPINVSESIHHFTSIYTLDQERMEIQVSIPPGGKLYIDSENFNILLNGSNVLHLHQGDWIHVDRETIRLVLDAGSGRSLNGNLLVTERYL